MRKRNKIVCTLLITAMIGAQPLTALADEQTGDTTTGTPVTSIAPGNNGQNTAGSTTSDTNQSSGTTGSSSTGKVNNTYQPTEAESGAWNEKSSVKGSLQNYIDRIKNSNQYFGTGDISQGGNMLSYGMTQLTEDEVQNLLDHIKAFEKYLSQQDGLGSSVNDYNEVKGTELPQKALPAIEGDWDKLSKEDQDKIKDKITEQEGIPDNTSDRTKLDGSSGNSVTLKDVSPAVPPLQVIYDYITAGTRGDYSGIRNDLIRGGLNDCNSWSNRFKGLERVTSNNMEDYCVLAYIKDYHISNVKIDDVNVIDWTSDQRRWRVTNTDTGEIMHPKGADKDGYIITDNPQHALSLAFAKAGHYKVVAEQKARYTMRTSVKYDICDYLFDAETRTLLYFNERLVSNNSGGSVYIDGEENEGWVETGDVFNWNVNDLGEIEKDGSATERVE